LKKRFVVWEFITVELPKLYVDSTVGGAHWDGTGVSSNHHKARKESPDNTGLSQNMWSLY